MDIGRIEALALRTHLAGPPARVDGARAIAGVGLDGDAHADPLSPRQLLLAGTDAYDAFALPPHALRENLLVDLDTSRLRSGTVLQVGHAVLLRLMFQCEACGHLDAHRPGLSTRIDKSWLVLESIENAEHDRCVDLFRRPDGSFGFEAVPVATAYS